MNIIISSAKPDFAEAAAHAVNILNSDDGAQFVALRRLDTPEGVLHEWAYSTLDRGARARRKALLYSVRYGSTLALVDGEIVATPLAPTTDPDAWKAAHPEIVAAFDIQFRALPPRAPA